MTNSGAQWTARPTLTQYLSGSAVQCNLHRAVRTCCRSGWNPTLQVVQHLAVVELRPGRSARLKNQLVAALVRARKNIQT